MKGAYHVIDSQSGAIPNRVVLIPREDLLWRPQVVYDKFRDLALQSSRAFDPQLGIFEAVQTKNAVATGRTVTEWRDAA